jgi:HPt (histidine-containing phosphotransfer) domain-containing protein
MQKFIVRVDPELCDLIPGFLARKRHDALTILAGVSGNRIDFETLSRIAHNLKGEGGSYGLDAISIYGAEIEQAARNHDALTICDYAKKLSVYLDSIQVEYESPPE